MRLHTLTILAVILILGCIGQQQIILKCPSGETVTDYNDCPKPTFQTGKPALVAAIRECDKSTDIDVKYACYTGAALDNNDLKTCDSIDDRWWKYFCYQKLGGDWVWGPLETTTTRLTTTTTVITSTTTTTLCGNGILDPAEECDMGQVCSGTEGVCGLTPTKPTMATCLIDEQCNWNIQTTVSGQYIMGSCNGCLGPNSKNPCRCMGVNVLNYTIIPLPAGVNATPTTTLALYHSRCQDGFCYKEAGEGINECSTSDDCRHYDCVIESGKNKCGLVRTPGTSSCTSDSQCTVSTT